MGAAPGSETAQLEVDVSSTRQQQYVSSRLVIILYKFPDSILLYLTLGVLILDSNTTLVNPVENG